MFIFDDAEIVYFCLMYVCSQNLPPPIGDQRCVQDSGFMEINLSEEQTQQSKMTRWQQLTLFNYADIAAVDCQVNSTSLLLPAANTLSF